MAHHLIVMKEGDILESGPVAQVLHQPQHEYTRILMASSD
jgi:microcin C transport system ATP-binding protein